MPFDIRRAHPYSVYPELDFDIPTRTEGDCLARYLLRIDEIKQSLRIIDQCLHEMPDGPVMAKLPRLLRPRPGRAYAAIEGPRGQYASYAISDGTDQPFRMRIHDPSFVHLQSVGLLMPGNLDRRHDGDHGLPRPDHGRSGQVDDGRRADLEPADRSPARSSAVVVPLGAVLTIGAGRVLIALLGGIDPRLPGRQPAARPVRPSRSTASS